MGILEEGWAGGARERDHDGRQAGRTVGLQAQAPRGGGATDPTPRCEKISLADRRVRDALRGRCGPSRPLRRGRWPGGREGAALARGDRSRENVRAVTGGLRAVPPACAPWVPARCWARS